MIDTDVLKDKLQERIDSRTIQITGGAIGNIEEYRTIVGQITGIHIAMLEIEDLLKKQREAEQE